MKKNAHQPTHPPTHPPQNRYKDITYGEETKQNMYFYGTSHPPIQPPPPAPNQPTHLPTHIGTLLDKTQKDEPAGRSIRQVNPPTHPPTHP